MSANVIATNKLGYHEAAHLVLAQPKTTREFGLISSIHLRAGCEKSYFHSLREKGKWKWKGKGKGKGKDLRGGCE